MKYKISGAVFVLCRMHGWKERVSIPQSYTNAAKNTRMTLLWQFNCYDISNTFTIVISVAPHNSYAWAVRNSERINWPTQLRHPSKVGCVWNRLQKTTCWSPKLGLRLGWLGIQGSFSMWPACAFGGCQSASSCN